MHVLVASAGELLRLQGGGRPFLGASAVSAPNHRQQEMPTSSSGAGVPPRSSPRLVDGVAHSLSPGQHQEVYDFCSCCSLARAAAAAGAAVRREK